MALTVGLAKETNDNTSLVNFVYCTIISHTYLVIEKTLDKFAVV